MVGFMGDELFKEFKEHSVAEFLGKINTCLDTVEKLEV